MDRLRIISLLPAATEIIYLLGLEKFLVGVSHACNYPKEARFLPKITSTSTTNSLSSKQINDKVLQRKHSGQGVFHLNEKVLKELKPNLILTQEICEVCAVSWTEVKKAARVLESGIMNNESGLKIVSLEPESIEDILENILLVGEVCNKRDKASEEVSKLKERLRNIELRLKQLSGGDKKKVLMVEWLEPLMVAGHWVPEMVERAGGINVKTIVGDKSYTISVEEIVESPPDLVVFAPCGFDIERTLREKRVIEDLRLRIKDLRIEYFLMNGDAYLTRPGPRIIDGVEILAEILHPKVFTREHSIKDWREV